ncbi:MAG: hypothetical protein CMM87_01775 [Rickettsiales bacterium]|nr:hypothetical protein [Rickettsiales bacterium]|tara:strand:- start:13122 stop:13544 length:423 start_codon:yes stop_codon:yes gene_type:complete
MPTWFDSWVLAVSLALMALMSVQDIKTRQVYTVDLLFVTIWFALQAQGVVDWLIYLISVGGLTLGTALIAQRLLNKKVCGVGDVWLLAVILASLPLEKWPHYLVLTGVLGIIWHMLGIQKPKPAPMIFILSLVFGVVYFL